MSSVRELDLIIHFMRHPASKPQGLRGILRGDLDDLDDVTRLLGHSL
jgi:hypothetical protein